jgi:hypothetical protein
MIKWVNNFWIRSTTLYFRLGARSEGTTSRYAHSQLPEVKTNISHAE